MVTIATTRTLHTPPITLIFFLATADFLMGSLHLFFVSIAWFTNTWIGGPFGEYSVSVL